MGLTQQELAEKLGVRKTTVSNYETSFSSPPKSVLIQIADFFGVSLDELLGTGQSSSITPLSVFMNSPAPEKTSPARSVRIFSSLSDTKDIINVRGLYDTVSFTAPMPSGEYFGLVCPDNSLKSRGIFKGDYIIFKSQELVKVGDITAVSINSAPAVIGIFHETDSEVGFIPLTIDETHTPRFFSKKDTSFKILGKAVRAVVNLN